MWENTTGIIVIYPLALIGLLFLISWIFGIFLPDRKRRLSTRPSKQKTLDFPMSSKLKLINLVQQEANASMGLCKRALEEVNYDIGKAIDLLYVTNSVSAGIRLTNGRVHSAVFDNVAVILEVNCETDFSSRDPRFGILMQDLCFQIAIRDPKQITRDHVGHAFDPLSSVPPPLMTSENFVLLEQESIIPDHKGMTVQQVINDLSDKLGDRIVIRRFTRYQLGA